MNPRFSALAVVRKAVPFCLFTLASLVWTGCIGDPDDGQTDSNPNGSLSDSAVVSGARVTSAAAKAESPVGNYGNCWVYLRLTKAGNTVRSNGEVRCNHPQKDIYLEAHVTAPGWAAQGWDAERCSDHEQCSALATIPYTGKGKYTARVDVLTGNQTMQHWEIYKNF